MQRFLAFFETRTGRFIRFAFSATLVGWFALHTDWGQLTGTRGKFLLLPALLALFLAGLSYPLHGVRWWLLMRAQGLALSFNWSHAVTWIGQFYNAFLLGGFGGDAARIFYLCRDEPSRRAGGLAAIVLDRVMGLAVLMSLAVAALVAKAGVLAREPGLRWVFAIALAVCAGIAVVTFLLLYSTPARWPAWLRRMLGPARTETAAGLLEKVRATPVPHLQAIVISYVIWLLEIASVWFLALAVGLSLPLLETSVAVAVAYAVTALPISVGGHGVREGALLGVLGIFGLLPAGTAARESALLLAMLVWAVTMIWSAVGGIVLLAAGKLVPAARPVAA